MFMKLSLPPIHLPPIMALDAPNRLSETVSMSVLVVGLLVFVLVIYQTRILPRHTGTVKYPIVPGISALNRHIVWI